MKQDESFGIIPLSKKKDQWEVFLIQHRSGGYWGFPKGHAEPNETPFQAASRELKEETNLDCAKLLWEKPLHEEYWFQFEGKRVFKTVRYFIAEVKGVIKLQKGEINSGIWLGFPQAIEKVTHQEGKAILKQVAHILKIELEYL